jgi:hypothetical protein
MGTNSIRTPSRELTDAEESFIREYKKIARYYGLCVGACGCCNSPFVTNFDPKYNRLEDHIAHLRLETAEPTWRPIGHVAAVRLLSHFGLYGMEAST